ncbi:MAG: hypothetical protein KGQ57_13780 [Burkholderiales bacterium]|nr:hypothetical protein [Burkholderiales bacterium]
MTALSRGLIARVTTICRDADELSGASTTGLLPAMTTRRACFDSRREKRWDRAWLVPGAVKWG